MDEPARREQKELTPHDDVELFVPEPQSATDITKLITKDYRAAGSPAASDEPGMLIDPVCGMTVPSEGAEITLVHEGTTYAFCAAVCKKVFVEEHALSA